MAEPVIIKFKRLKKNLAEIPLPSYSTSGSAGMDVHAGIEEPIILKPGEVELVPTNLSVEIPTGYEIQVRPRSGLAAKHSIGILNSPGTIDSDYRGDKNIINKFWQERIYYSTGGENCSTHSFTGLHCTAY